MPGVSYSRARTGEPQEPKLVLPTGAIAGLVTPRRSGALMQLTAERDRKLAQSRGSARDPRGRSVELRAGHQRWTPTVLAIGDPEPVSV